MFTVTNASYVTTVILGPVMVPAGFTLTEGLSGSLTPGASDTFTVRLDTVVAGTKTGKISFANCDAPGGDGVQHTFHFQIAGRILTRILIVVLSNGVSLTNGDTTPSTAEGTDFGSVAQGCTSASRTFTIRNDGAAAPDAGTGNGSDGLYRDEAPASSLAGGASDTFTVRLETAVLGTKTGEISFANNDAAGYDGVENPFHFAITGVVVAGVLVRRSARRAR